MLFYANAQGEIVAAIPSPVNQGSIGVNEIILIAPFPATVVVSATFTLPNGIKLYPQYVDKSALEASDYAYKFALVDGFNGVLPAPDGVTVNVWRLTLDRALTQVSGTVTVQFLITGEDGTLASSSSTFNVGRGNAYLSPSVTTKDINTITAYLKAAKTAAENAENDADAASEAAEAAKVAQSAAEAAQGKAEDAEAKAAEHAALYEEILPRLEYDHVITTKAELATLPTLTGRVLIDIKESLELDEPMELVVQARLLHIANLVISGNELKLNGNAGEIKNVGFTDAALSLSFFYRVSGFQSNVIDLTACYNITNSVIRNASECLFLDNCYADDSGNAKFYKCAFICGVCYFGLTSGITRFEECAYISNVLCEGVYDNCTFVDAETCKGFIPAEDYGKVQTLSDDGTYEAKVLPQIISASINDDYVLTVKLFDGNEEVEISSAEIDLPLETMVVGASVSDDGSKLILELKNGNTVEIPVENIVSGLATRAYVDDDVVPKLAYDHVITTEEEFENLSNLSGRILVKPLTLTKSHNLSVSGELSFEGTISMGYQKSLTLNGVGDNAKVYGGRFVSVDLGEENEYYDINLYLYSFAAVENVWLDDVDFESSSLIENCQHVKNCVVHRMENCTFIDNCKVRGLDYGTAPHFINCKFICGVSTTGGYSDEYRVVFVGCSYISNVECVGEYTNCTYVDAESCKSFIPDDAVGKVQTLTQDGSFDTFDPNSKLDVKNGVTTFDQAYCKGADGSQRMYDIMYSRYTGNINGRNGLVYMDAGQILCGTPTADNHGANKAYVDTISAQVATTAVNGLRTHVYTVTADKPYAILPGQSVIIFSGGKLTLTFNYVGGGTFVYEVGDNIAAAGVDIDSAWGYAIRVSGLTTGIQTKQDIGSITVTTDGTNLMFTH